MAGVDRPRPRRRERENGRASPPPTTAAVRLKRRWALARCAGLCRCRSHFSTAWRYVATIHNVKSVKFPAAKTAHAIKCHTYSSIRESKFLTRWNTVFRVTRVLITDQHQSMYTDTGRKISLCQFISNSKFPTSTLPFLPPKLLCATINRQPTGSLEFFLSKYPIPSLTVDSSLTDPFAFARAVP